MLETAERTNGAAAMDAEIRAAPIYRDQYPEDFTRVAVILPCLNEAPAIADVIAAFGLALPGAAIFVIDNGSTDGTGLAAKAAGAKVIVEKQRGKGSAVRRAFAAIDADFYVVADGDGTYDAARAPELIDLLVRERLEMVVAVRRKVDKLAYRKGHELGNRLFNRGLRACFGSEFQDVFSGYRVLSRRYVRSFPALSEGFEIETEMSVHALMLRMPVAEVVCDYAARQGGSQSKLRTYRDGMRIAWSIARLLRQHRPLAFFSVIAGLMLGAGAALFYPVLTTYLDTGLVPRFPTLIVSISLSVMAMVMIVCGVILDTVIRTQLEIRRLLYLSAGRPQREW
jgi:hypothetical protein